MLYSLLVDLQRKGIGLLVVLEGKGIRLLVVLGGKEQDCSYFEVEGKGFVYRWCLINLSK